MRRYLDNNFQLSVRHVSCVCDQASSSLNHFFIRSISIYFNPVWVTACGMWLLRIMLGNSDDNQDSGLPYGMERNCASTGWSYLNKNAFLTNRQCLMSSLHRTICIYMKCLCVVMQQAASHDDALPVLVSGIINHSCRKMCNISQLHSRRYSHTIYIQSTDILRVI